MRAGVRVLVLLLVGLAACAGARGEPVGRQDRDVITREEISRHRTVYDAVQALRSTWLRPRSAGGFQATGEVKVYLDGRHAGSVDLLRTMATAGIGSVRFYDGIEASSRWGLGHEGGVIFVASQQANSGDGS